MMCRYFGILLGFLFALSASSAQLAAQALPYGTFTSHTDGQIVTSSAITITWKGCSNATQSSIVTRINGVNRTTTQSNGLQCPDYSVGKNYSASGTLTIGANTLFLRVCDVSGCGQTTITVYYYTPAVSVTPDGATAPSILHGSPGSYAFTVTNSGGVPATASFSASCTGALSSCSVSPTSASLSKPTTVTVSYTGATVGSGVASLTAIYNEYPTVTDSGSVNVTVTANPTYSVSVVPVNPSQSVPVGTALIQFDVTNTSQDTPTPSTFNLSTTVTGTVGSCAVSPTSVTLSPGAPAARITATCTITGSPTTGSVRLDASTASPTSFSGSGTTNVTVTSTATLGVVTSGRNPRTTVDRSGCLTIAAGQSAAYECGDLRLVHPIPATATMDRTRGPVMIYNSRHANPSALLAADVTYDGPTPAILRATVTVPGQANVVHDFAWSSACAALACRIVVPISTTQPTSLYPATLQISAINGIYTYATSAAVTDTVVVVNRAASPFGAGWWLDGLENLVTISATKMLWIGGDGSTRLYTRTADTTVYKVTPAYDRPDSLKRILGTPQTWRRLLGDGSYVEFNSTGQHTRTVNPLGWSTRFTYVGALLDSIVLPVPSGSSQTRAYRFSYTSSLLDSIRAPMASFARTVRVTRGGTSRINSITDPDGLASSFGYDALNRVISRRNKLGDTTYFQYDDGGALKQAKLSTARTDGAGASITTNFRAAETRSVFSTSDLPTPLAKAYAQLDGPRTDVADTTIFFVDPWGAPDTVTNALGKRTRLYHGTSTFPALVTRSIDPTGFDTRAYFNARGLADSTVAINPYGTGSNAVTKYAWNPVWLHADSVIGPTGERTRTFYSSARPLVDSVRTGTNVARRVKFTYTVDGQVRSVTEPAGVPDSILYDAVGNAAKTWTPLGRAASTPYFGQYFKDGIGRDTLMVHPISGDTTGTTRIVFDAADRVIETVDSGPPRPYSFSGGSPFTVDTSAITALIQTDTKGYDAEGNLVSQTSSSSPFSIGVSEQFLYDAAGRLRRRNIGSGPDSMVYDPAGNMISSRYRSGLWIAQSYDALNELVQRVVPERVFPKERCESYPAGPISGFGGCFMIFPYYPNAGDSLKIVADTAKFVYDAAGRMTQANNRYARVHRGYYLGGDLKTDSTAIGRILAPLTDSIKRGQQYTYDLSGHRTAMQWLRGPTSYAYNDFGALATVTDSSGNNYGFAYTLAGEIGTLSLGTGVTETRSYDSDGRMISRNRASADQSLGTLVTGTLTYDRMNRIIHSVETSHGHIAEDTRIAYDGLGAVLANEQTSGFGTNVQEFRNDGFGNVLYRKTQRTAGTNDAPFVLQYNPQGPMRSASAVLTSSPNQNQRNDDFGQTFAGGGQLIRQSQLVQNPNDASVSLELAARHYYGADDKLMVVQRYSYRGPSPRDGTWEEYWYDALGRRVLTRARRDPSLIYDAFTSGPLCSGGIQCRSFTERVWWDGDQALVEQRTPEGTSDVSNSGIIGNIHGLTLDEPLAVMSDQTRIVNYNWRGQGESSVFPNGSAADASLDNVSTEIDWPALTEAETYFTPGPGSGDDNNPKRWMGTFVANGQGTTGMLYRRNRYFSPASGQFTQADPLGIAGGMNAFGFAGGDPVNFSDPFGLCTPMPQCLQGWGSLIDALGGTRGVPVTGPDGPGLFRVGGSASFGLVTGSCKIGSGCEPGVNLTPQVGASVDFSLPFRSAKPDEPGVTVGYGVNKHLGVSISNEEFTLSVGVGVGSAVSVSVTPGPGRPTVSMPVPVVKPDATAVRRKSIRDCSLHADCEQE
jgi:RHS repeat-associated protein